MFFLLSISAIVVVALASAKRFGYDPMFAVLYYLYARTFVGRWLHLNRLSAATKAQKGSHSKVKLHRYSGVTIKPIAILDDNYAYLIIDHNLKLGILVDPSEPRLVQEALKAEDINLAAILITHGHWDHSGGNTILHKLYPDIAIYGNSEDNVPNLTHFVKDGDSIKIGTLVFDVIGTPGHTLGHVMYTLNRKEQGEPSSVFSGDHLFLAGCGRIFEGNGAMMLKSLDRLLELDDKTLVWPGHEYATSNLKFAIAVEPSNKAIIEKLTWADSLRNNCESTCPSTIDEEKSYNPFLRSHIPEISKTLGCPEQTDYHNQNHRAEVVSLLRSKKNSFKAK
ncbi:putative hydrolase PNKD [Trichoplax sp. H2]|nr:putative hydrolase PNKD [Trichoplax sp. H2]|eukprot:RDD45818.1 putative hydrolase PNKD [Trichoplax sp. H2]